VVGAGVAFITSFQMVSPWIFHGLRFGLREEPCPYVYVAGIEWLGVRCLLADQNVVCKW